MTGHRAKQLVAAILLVAFWPQLALAQALAPAGVVTTITGTATVARASLPADQLPLRFKDPVFGRDTIRTGERAVVRVLLGGKALVTVREQSVFTVSEEAGRSQVGLETGKLAVAVARQRMRPGESIEVRTPNVIAAVRGTVAIFEILRASAQAVPGPVPVTSTLYVLKGSVEVLPRLPGTAAAGARLAALQAPVTVGALQSLSVTGTVFGPIRPIPPTQIAQILAGLKSAPQHQDTPEDTKKEVSSKQQAQATTLASLLAPDSGDSSVLGATTSAAALDTTTPTTTTPSTPILPPITGGTGSGANGLFENGGFETGTFAGWTKTGAGSVISALGSIEAPEGSYMAILHTGTGAVGNTTSTLTSGGIATGSVFRVKVKYNFLSNEFPSEAERFNDTLTIKVIDGAGATALQRTESRNTSFTSSTVSEETATAGGFTIMAGNGVTGWKEIDQTVVSTGSGLDSIFFEIKDLGDTIVDSAVLVDAVAILEDPPLYLLRDGSTLTRPAGTPLYEAVGRTESFDSLLIVCCGSSAVLGGPLLRATDSALTVPFSLLSAVQGGRVVSTSLDPLVQLAGGTYTLGREVGMLDLAGVASALDPDTGLVLGSDRPLQHAGTFLEATAATVSTHSVARLDTALLEASAPLLDLRQGSTMTASGHVADLSYQARVTSLGPLVRLDASTLSLGGAVVNVNASVFSGTGSLLALANGSTLNARLLASVSGGGLFSWSGPLATFTGAGNSINLTNSLCAGADCITAGGLRFALRNGAVAANVTVTNPTPFVGAAGTVNVAPTAAHFLVSGSGSRVTLAP